MNKLTLVKIAAWSVVVVLLIAVAAVTLRPAGTPATMLGMTGEPFALASTSGTRFTEGSLRGAPSLLYFGYTSCPDACPITLAAPAAYREQLKISPDELRIILVSVDPERDTLPVLKNYLSGFGTPMIGLSGSTSEVEAAKTAFGGYSKKGAVEGAGSYSVHHTATVFLTDRNGGFEGTIDYGENASTALAKIKRLISD